MLEKLSEVRGTDIFDSNIASLHVIFKPKGKENALCSEVNQILIGITSCVS